MHRGHVSAVALAVVLASGAVDPLLRTIQAEAEHGVRERFARAQAPCVRADERVALGREAVAAYVDNIHHVERLLEAAAGAHGHGTPHEEP